MANYSTYIFDLDGTLLNTLGDLTASVNHALRQHGLEGKTQDEVCKMVGNGITKLVERAVGEAGTDFAVLLKSFSQHYALHCMDTTAPYAGITEMLQQLREKGKKIAVVSNKTDSAVRTLVQHFFPALVDIAIGEHEGVRRKPAPDMVLEAMRMLGCEADECIYVGDSDVDLDTAHAAGVECISVLWGFREKELLEAHGATHFAATPGEIAATA